MGPVTRGDRHLGSPKAYRSSISTCGSMKSFACGWLCDQVEEGRKPGSSLATFQLGLQHPHLLRVGEHPACFQDRRYLAERLETILLASRQVLQHPHCHIQGQFVAG